MKFKPANDGVDHVNVYSQGKTQLGKLLSNFADTPFEIEGKGKFKTVEGFWYWTMTGLEELRDLPGWQCKEVGRRAETVRSHPNETELFEAYEAKLDSNPHIITMLLNNNLPLAHYYVYSGNIVEPKEWQWTALLWNKVADKIRGYGK